jgi:hypothetical protein
MKKYPALLIIASFLRIIGVIIIIAGLFFMLFTILNPSIELYPTVFHFSLLTSVAIFVCTFIWGVILYAMGDFFRCVIDIEFNTRIHESPFDSITAKQRKIVELQSQIAEDLKRNET